MLVTVITVFVLIVLLKLLAYNLELRSHRKALRYFETTGKWIVPARYRLSYEERQFRANKGRLERWYGIRNECGVTSVVTEHPSWIEHHEKLRKNLRDSALRIKKIEEGKEK